MPQSLKIDSLLDHGKYRIERILGQGGFGITYLATDLSLERTVAIKEFFPKDYCERLNTTSHITVGTRSNVELVERLKAKFLKEARNIAKLDHPDIIRIHSAFEENNTAYYVMDYIEGRNLSEIVKHNGPLSESKAIQYITKVGETLEYIHQKNINHLDIKPANIMIRKADDRPVLIDFGLSKQYDAEGKQTSTTPTGISHGFAPLEQYKAGGVSIFSPQTDVYSLAATLYYLISGQVPPHATDIAQDGINFPAGFPADIGPAITKAMSSGRKNRHNSVAQFIKSLTVNSETEDTLIIHPKPVPPAPRPTPDGPKPVPPTPTPRPGGINTVPQTPPGPAKILLQFVGIPLCVCIILIVIILALCYLANSETPSGNEGSKPPVTVNTVPNLVTGTNIQTTLGNATYTGNVDEMGRPHGYGVAVWTTGDAMKYDGNWEHGNMDGQTTYTLRCGDTFVGTYKNNRYDEGRYTIAEDGSYFEGSFKDGQPDVGSWFDKFGNKIN